MINLLEFARAQGTPINSSNCGFCSFPSLGGFVSAMLIPAFSIAGVLLVLYILWGGFKWLTSGGSKEGIAAAQAMITHAVIGIALLVLLFILFEFIPQAFGVNFNIFG
jgi:hypothetical protein